MSKKPKKYFYENDVHSLSKVDHLDIKMHIDDYELSKLNLECVIDHRFLVIVSLIFITFCFYVLFLFDGANKQKTRLETEVISRKMADERLRKSFWVSSMKLGTTSRTSTFEEFQKQYGYNEADIIPTKSKQQQTAESIVGSKEKK